ncbi:Formyltransferase [Plenodomus tracheiphilus IPT5]|uniref:methionyl-tRNA formyltransferase n=1 Tax=Plenodomus tracheiphilus IPT5 TaxID=1408161 RepID=A0A6A7ARS9_9PLEO|nr:Formyltransferase [Plenodomus tracheiphilus IPT5]
MPWRLPGPVRSLALSSHRRLNSTTPPTYASDALRILFCGSDEFSIASLRALTAAKYDALIDSIHVVHRPAKPTGRGLKQLREVPIEKVAREELRLPTYALDTFTGWTPPTSINLIIAVSFGLFVPSRLLHTAKFGGLNVHPSLLPDLKGPAPIQYAILKRRQYTGVSIQTLHPQHFDQGCVLAQTPAPGIEVPWGTTAEELEAQLAKVGASMLVDVLKSRMYMPPLEDAGWYARSNGPRDHAPKISKQDRCIVLETSRLKDILTIQYGLGDPWCLIPHGERLILHQIVDSGVIHQPSSTPGIWAQEGCDFPLLRDVHGHVGIILESTLAGGRAGAGNATLLHLLPKEKVPEGQLPIHVSRGRR